MMTQKNLWNEPFQGKKNWREFDLTILKVKQIYYKRIEVFTIRFNPNSTATCSDLLTWPRASSEFMDSFFP